MIPSHLAKKVKSRQIFTGVWVCGLGYFSVFVCLMAAYTNIIILIHSFGAN